MAKPLRVPASPALEELLREDEERGIHPLADAPPPPGPPERVEPLIRIPPPLPDWRAEERERAERDAATAQVEPEAELQPKPTLKDPISPGWDR
jgi:hypothetical protein